MRSAGLHASFLLLFAFFSLFAPVEASEGLVWRGGAALHLAHGDHSAVVLAQYKTKGETVCSGCWLSSHLVGHNCRPNERKASSALHTLFFLGPLLSQYVLWCDGAEDS